MDAKRFIGITGGIGSGKSRVSRFWSAYERLPLIDIDHLCRELLEAGRPGWSALKQQLDTGFFGPDGQLDRQLLRSAIFNDEKFRLTVDRLIHPLALDLLYRRTEKMTGVLLVDVPLLFEAGWEKHCHRTVVVYADRHTCCRRISRRDSVRPDDAAKAIFSQMDIREKALRADHVVDNRYCWLMTRMQVAHLAHLVRDEYGHAD